MNGPQALMCGSRLDGLCGKCGLLRRVVYPFRLVSSEVVTVLEELQKAQSMHIMKVREWEQMMV